MNIGKKNACPKSVRAESRTKEIQLTNQEVDNLKKQKIPSRATLDGIFNFSILKLSYDQFRSTLSEVCNYFYCVETFSNA